MQWNNQFLFRIATYTTTTYTDILIDKIVVYTLVVGFTICGGDETHQAHSEL